MATGQGEGGRGKGEARNQSDIDSLFQLSLSEFTPARNALATTLKKAGDTEEAERVKALAKPPLSAWVANQLYWHHRSAFDRLLTAGDKFRTAQAAQLAGKPADLRAPLDARREALSALTTLAANVLRDSGHPASPETMRRITTTLESLATYGAQANVPPAGRLTGDVDPPGFEALAALVPRSNAAARHGSTPPRVIPFSQPRTESPAKRKGSTAEENAARRDAERRQKQVEARKALLDAERALKEAKHAAEQARAAMKKAAERAKAAEEAKASLETRLEKASAEADAARRDARLVASHAEEAAQAMDDAERAVARARETLKER